MGNPATAMLSEGRCQVADLSSNLDFGNRWDWIISLEVAEHIPGEFEDNFLKNLDRHARHGIVRPKWEVVQRLEALGFESLELAAATLREVASLPWFKDTLLGVRRTGRDPAE